MTKGDPAPVPVAHVWPGSVGFESHGAQVTRTDDNPAMVIRPCLTARAACPGPTTCHACAS